MPVPSFNVISGGSRAGNCSIELTGASSVTEDMITDTESFHSLKSDHQEDVRRGACNVGDETGFAPSVQFNSETSNSFAGSPELDLVSAIWATPSRHVPSQVFVCCVHRMAPIACRPTIKCGKTGCTGSFPPSVVECGYTAGQKPATCRTCGKTFPRPNVTLSDFPPAEEKRKGGTVKNASPATSRRSSWVSWSDSPREQSAPSGEDIVMEDCTESHQSEINRKIKANDKLRQILTNMPEEHSVLIFGDSFRSNMQSLDDEETALLAAKRQFLPLPSRIEKQKAYLERVSKEIETS